MTEPPPTPGLASITEIDRVVHEPARLLLMATLYVLDSADYTFCTGTFTLTERPVESITVMLSALPTVMSRLRHIIIKTIFLSKCLSSLLRLICSRSI